MRRARVAAVACAATVAATLVATGCGGVPTTSPTASTGDGQFVGVADAAWEDQDMADASVRLAARMVAVGAGQNVVVSPVSLQLALAVLREGASGAAAAQLDEVLGLAEAGSQGVADLRAVLAGYEGDVAGIDPENPPEVPVLHIADGLFVQPGLDVRPAFVDRAAAFHRTELYDADFARGTAQAVLDGWVAEQTGGLLTQAPAVPPEETLLVIMDAITFGATWRSQFPPEASAALPFTLADGTQVQAPMMAQTLSTTYAESDGWRAVELAYSDGFVMRLALADGHGSPDWAAVADGLAEASEQSVRVVMPSWTTSSTLDLLPMLKGLGLGAIARAGDLDGVFTDAVVSAVAQGATITVAEGGTVAAAATEVAVGRVAAPAGPTVELILDRPFEYQVVHEATGMVVFAGRVENPSV